MGYCYQYDYFYDSTALIVNHFESVGIQYDIVINDKFEEIITTVATIGGPVMHPRIICSYDENDVAMRATLVRSVPREKRSEALEMCNKLNDRGRYLYFCLNYLNDIVMKYDVPAAVSDDCLGKVVSEILMTLKFVVSEYYMNYENDLC